MVEPISFNNDDEYCTGVILTSTYFITLFCSKVWKVINSNECMYIPELFLAYGIPEGIIIINLLSRLFI